MTNLELKEQQGSQGAPNIVDAVHAGEVTFDVSKAEMQGHQAGPDIIEALDGTNLMNLHDFERAQQQGNQCPPLIKFGNQPGPDPDPGTLYFVGGPNGGGMVHMRSSLSSVPDLQYSTDGTEWYDWPYNTSDGTTVFDEMQLAEGQKIYVRGTNSTLFESDSAYARFLGSGFIGSGGNIQSLVDRHSFPSTAICMRALFQGMTSLISAPLLPATTLVADCYRSMFNECSSLASLPEGFALPATDAADGCYRLMFKNCSSLVNLPSSFTIGLTNVGYESCLQMFQGCSSLVSLPDGALTDITSLAVNGMQAMFKGCTSLVSIGEGFTVSATNAPTNCLRQIFHGCTSLLDVPSTFGLGPSTLGSNCYSEMFSGTNVVMSTDGTNFKFPVGVTFPYSGAFGTFATPMAMGNAMDDIIGFAVQYDGLYFEGGPNGGGTVQMRAIFDNRPDLQYSTDGTDWQDWPHTTSGSLTEFNPITLAEGQRIYARGTNSTFFAGAEYARFLMSGYIKTGGKIQSLVTRDMSSDTAINMCQLFSGASSLIEVSIIFAKRTINGCYQSMFKDCDNLTSFLGELPATEVSASSYSGMFEGCIRLTTLSPNFRLNATTVGQHAYHALFKNCSSLVTLPEGFTLPATSGLAHDYQGQYTEMFASCNRLEYLPSTFRLPCTTNMPRMYERMFDGCSALRALPEGFTLPISGTLSFNAYFCMFRNCVALASLPTSFALPATAINNGCYRNMFLGALFAMSTDGTNIKFPVGVTYPFSLGSTAFNNPKDLATWMGNTNGFN